MRPGASGNQAPTTRASRADASRPGPRPGIASARLPGNPGSSRTPTPRPRPRTPDPKQRHPMTDSWSPGHPVRHRQPRVLPRVRSRQRLRRLRTLPRRRANLRRRPTRRAHRDGAHHQRRDDAPHRRSTRTQRPLRRRRRHLDARHLQPNTLNDTTTRLGADPRVSAGGCVVRRARPSNCTSVQQPLIGASASTLLSWS